MHWSKNSIVVYIWTPQLGDLAQAEDALSEANILSNHDPLTWAFLCLTCLKVGSHPRP